ncbi:unnamed protein product [Brugia pahangi]|uniref:Uncharacterized protein n=1 Tax=Brugia pahangi TaxID=6280 RepID=A0A0N4TN57_BRUPA|nr:unnamed protein product [Brugia pahangi]
MIRVRSHGGLYELKGCIPIKVNVGKIQSKSKVKQEFSSCVFSHIFQVIQLNSKVFDPLDPDSNIRIKPYFL